MGHNVQVLWANATGQGAVAGSLPVWEPGREVPCPNLSPSLQTGLVVGVAKWMCACECVRVYGGAGRGIWTLRGK